MLSTHWPLHLYLLLPIPASCFSSLQLTQFIQQPNHWTDLHFCELPIPLPTSLPWDILPPALGSWPSLSQTFFPALGTHRLQTSAFLPVLISLTDFNWVYICTWRALRLVSSGERLRKPECKFFLHKTSLQIIIKSWGSHESMEYYTLLKASESHWYSVKQTTVKSFVS